MHVQYFVQARRLIDELPSEEKLLPFRHKMSAVLLDEGVIDNSMARQDGLLPWNTLYVYSCVSSSTRAWSVHICSPECRGLRFAMHDPVVTGDAACSLSCPTTPLLHARAQDHTHRLVLPLRALCMRARRCATMHPGFPTTCTHRYENYTCLAAHGKGGDGFGSDTDWAPEIEYISEEDRFKLNTHVGKRWHALWSAAPR